jgi:phage terminase large subunit-like protein
VVISTQAPTDADLLSVLIDDAKTGADPQTKLFLYTAPVEMDPFSDEAIRAANPAFDEFMNQDEVRKLAQNAKRMPSREADYRNLVLNQRVQRRNLYVSAATWMINGKARRANLDGLVVYGGLDLSSVSDLTALVLIAQDPEENNEWFIEPRFWLPEEGIEEKSREDRVPYDMWANQGLLLLTPGKSIKYEFIAHELLDLFERYDISKIAFDRYNMKFLRPELERAGISDGDIAKFQEFGQGMVSMSPALREFESLLLDGKMRHGNHPVLTMCAANAAVISDAAGNRKFAKDRSNGRIDGMVATAMAVAMGTGEASERAPEYQMFFIG